jgi:beta-phosphoglucomutase-like phosphatase (HAD superfamily)
MAVAHTRRDDAGPGQATARVAAWRGVWVFGSLLGALAQRAWPAGLAAPGLAALFDAVVTWSDVPAGRGKPAPDIFLLAARRLDARPDRCLVYEDADAGVNAALAAGMTAYNVRTGRMLHPELWVPVP